MHTPTPRSRLQATLLGLAIAPMLVDFRSNMQKPVLADLLSSFGASQVMAGVRIDVSVAEAFGHRKPLRQHRINARAIDDFRVMADDLIHRFSLSVPSRAYVRDTRAGFALPASL